MYTTKSRRFGMIVLMLTLLAGPLSAIHPNQPQGLDPERSTQASADQIDQVDLFSGALNIAIPMGPFSLAYNSNVWRYRRDADGLIEAFPDRKMTAGLGWQLGWGEVYDPDHWYNDTGRWLYVSDDGGRHTFYDELHEGEQDGDSNVFYSRDGSYLRVRISSDDCHADIETPDGTTRRFTGAGGVCGAEAEKTFRKAWDRFGSASDPDLTVTYNADDTLRTLADRYGRQHFVHLVKAGDLLDGSPLVWMDRVVTQVDVASFHDQRAIYTLTYDNQVLTERSCKNQAPVSAAVRVPLLVEVELPDGSSYRMGDHFGPYYYTECTPQIDDLPGAIKDVKLPTGGSVEWSYQQVEFPPGAAQSVFNTTAGVEVRSLVRKNNTVDGTWTYKMTSIDPSNGQDAEMQTEVVYPTGDCSKHFFNARFSVDPAAGRGWEYGLPFTKTESSGDAFLSSEIWSSSNGTGGCRTIGNSEPLRSTFLRFRHDELPSSVCDELNPIPGCPTRADWLNRNRQPDIHRVVYHDDEDRFTQREFSEFDGLGNFRRSVGTGNLWDGSNNDERVVTTTGFNRSTGVYPGTYQPIAPSTPWLLKLLDHHGASRPEALGETENMTELEVDPNTGMLLCSRSLRTGTVRSTTDVMRVYSYDSRGNLTDEKIYGGDSQPLSTSGSGCGTAPGQPVYWNHHTYERDQRVTSRPRYPNGSDGPFLTYDVDLDPTTDKVIGSRNSAGIYSSTVYDVSGRPVEVRQDGVARAQLSYQLASPNDPAKSMMVNTPVNGSIEFTRGEVEYDDFGRKRLERSRQPTGFWTERETHYNARGWVTAISQTGDSNLLTEFIGHDPFGRPTVVVPPDGAVHELRMSYQGDRLSRLERKVKTSLTGVETWVSTTREKDRFGRLRRLREPSSTGGSEVATDYRYDVAGRLTEIRTPGAPQQVRSYTYDNRGFLLQETHPEKGVVGNGAVSYFDYDASGRAQRVVDGPNDLDFNFDGLGRLTATRDNNQGDRLVTSLVYDSPSPGGQGHLWKATRYNYLDLPWTPGSADDTVSVQHIYSYGGPNGAVSVRDTLFTWPGSSDRFRSWFGYDDLGNLDSLTYPSCVTGGCATSAASTSPTITTQYAEGRPIVIPGWVTSITYDDHGSWTEILHANGVRDVVEPHPTLRSRPGRVRTVGALPAGSDFDSGPFSYDGSGNIVALGTDTFAYDAVNRLTEASFGNATVAQQFSYDRFGNLTSRSTDGQTQTFVVDGATNRLSGAVAYDGAGNVTQWGGYGFGYDTSNRLVSQAWMRYIYDASGERVVSIPNVPQKTLHYHLRDLANNHISHVSYANGNYARERDWIYSSGRLIGWEDGGSGEKFHHHLDHLGSSRLVTREDRTVLAAPMFLAYGTEFPYPSGVDDHAYAGHERDQSTGADYMHARHYLSSIGRFLSVDEKRGHADNPQSLNRYAYVMGNPLNKVDPDGRESSTAIGLDQAANRYFKDRTRPYWTDEGLRRAALIVSPVLIGTVPGGFVFAKHIALGMTTRMAWNTGYYAVSGEPFDPGRDIVDNSIYFGFGTGAAAPLLEFASKSGPWGKVAIALYYGMLVGGIDLITEDGVEVTDVVKLVGGGTSISYSDGSVLETDSNGNVVFKGKPDATVDAKADEAAGTPQRDAYRRSLEEERRRGLGGFDHLQSFRCQISPFLCAGAGSQNWYVRRAY